MSDRQTSDRRQTASSLNVSALRGRRHNKSQTVSLSRPQSDGRRNPVGTSWRNAPLNSHILFPLLTLHHSAHYMHAITPGSIFGNSSSVTLNHHLHHHHQRHHYYGRRHRKKTHIPEVSMRMTMKTLRPFCRIVSWH